MKVMLLNAPSALLNPLAANKDLDIVQFDDAGRLKNYAHKLNWRVKTVAHRTTSKLDTSAIFALRRHISTHKPDVIHAFWGQSLANAVIATWQHRVRPKLISFRGIQTVPSKWDPTNHLTFLNPRVAWHACESNAVREGLIGGGIDPSKCHTVYNCVDSTDFRQVERRGPLWRNLNIPPRAFVIATVATIRPVKGIDLLLEAALRCLDLRKAYFLIIGPVHDPRVAELAADPRLKDSVRMTGYTRRAADLASCADVFVMPSRQEALCRALLEAMSLGLCPVVSAAGGMKEIVRHGQDGLVFPIEDVSALERSLRKLYRNREMVRELAASAAERVQEMCAPERMCERTVELYHRAA
jgi:glycosyltransferase involved in cell wall biosynthesis